MTFIFVWEEYKISIGVRPKSHNAKTRFRGWNYHKKNYLREHGNGVRQLHGDATENAEGAHGKPRHAQTGSFISGSVKKLFVFNEKLTKSICLKDVRKSLSLSKKNHTT